MNKEQTDHIINLLSSVTALLAEVRGIIQAGARADAEKLDHAAAPAAPSPSKVPYRAGKANFSRETDELIRLHGEGKLIHEIATALQIHRATVRNWMAKLNITPHKRYAYKPRFVSGTAKKRNKQLKKGAKNNG